MRCAELAGTGISDHRLPTMAAEGFSGKQVIDGAGGVFANGTLEHTLYILPGFLIYDGGDSAGRALVLPDIDAGIALLRQDMMDKGDVPRFAGGVAKTGTVQGPDDTGNGITGEIQGKDLANNSGPFRNDLILLIRTGGVPINASAVIQTAGGVVVQAALDVFGKIDGVPLSSSFQHAFQKDAGGSVRDRLHHIQNLDAETAQATLIDGRVLAAAAKAVDLPTQYGIEGAGIRCGHHCLKRGPGRSILETGTCVIRIFMHDIVPFTGGIGTDIRQLLLNGDIPLARGGIAGIGDSCAGRTGWFHDKLLITPVSFGVIFPY